MYVIEVMDQLNYVLSVIAITVCNVVLKIITKMDFQSRTNVRDLKSKEGLSGTKNLL